MTGVPKDENVDRDSFWDRVLFDLVVPKDRLLRTMKGLGARLIGLYQGRGGVGLPPYDPVMMFQMLFLSYLYDLSARDTERSVNENAPARYFLDLALDRSASWGSPKSIWWPIGMGGTAAHL